MSNKKKASRAITPRTLSPLQETYAQRTYVLSVVLVFCAIAKTATAALFDLGAITQLHGDPGSYLAVDSGLGRYCLVVAMLLFVGAGLGFNIKSSQSDKTVNQIIWVNALIAVACLASFVWSIVDGHQPLDILASLVGAAVSGAVAFCSIRIKA